MIIYAQYYVWLIIISLLVFLLERIKPWRKEQKVFRKGIWQDIFWLVFNGHYFGVFLAIISGKLVHLLNSYLLTNGYPVPESINLLSNMPFWVQFVIFFLIKDFIEWNIHRLFHIIPALWEFHKLHHTIKEMDWIGSMRLHWMEIAIYKFLAYLPLTILGASPYIIGSIVILNTLIGHLNHANLPISWGPFRYILNSPKMHIWHHDTVWRWKGGQNFGITLSIWDWIFGTAYMPGINENVNLGFKGIENYPESFVARFFYPFYKLLPIKRLTK